MFLSGDGVVHVMLFCFRFLFLAFYLTLVDKL